MIIISRNDFSVGDVLSKIRTSKTGAIVSFVGVVRGEEKGKKLVKMEIEAYEEMAEKELIKLKDHALKKFDVQEIIIWHRVGTLFPGDNIVLIAVSSAHRKDAFAATQFLIDELKKVVPLWKKEVYEDGEEWVEEKK
ncbi:MAG: molybdenum cofactor biosynthesis protein MoaE [Methanomassiliicoccales archaeon]|jgi:molybdopterin synthase catalytic subunit|nr:molybdenum cofactor biosynthesis protein MoaE [Methanomassiliicoccales archaeon]